MAEVNPNLLLHFEPRRDAYGFAVRPQHLQRFKEYANIFKEEDEERSDRWSKFLEHQDESSGDEQSETVDTEATELKQASISEENGHGNDSSERKSLQDDLPQLDPVKEPSVPKRIKSHNVHTWVNIRPSLSAIENLMSSRVKNRDNMKHARVSTTNKHLPSIDEEEGKTEEDFEEELSSHDSSDMHNNENENINEISSEPIVTCKEELESLVHGGIPKSLRGEVWQAFVGVKARRIEGYYKKLLSAGTNASDSEENGNSCSVPMKCRKQIEKDLPRTFPGHPALNENGRDSLRRVLLAYAVHNPYVGYCQAMNFFAGLLLLMMPEENAFWTLVGIVDDYFEGYFSEDMIESQVDQLVFEELIREKFPKLVNHLDYLGVQVGWISGPWFLSIFVNMLPWESVLRVWDVILFEGNRVMLFRTALALMELYGPALVTTKDAGDAITLLQSLAGSTFDSSQLVLTACMGFLTITEDRLQELRSKHRPSVLVVVEETSKGGEVSKDTKLLASKLYSFKRPSVPLKEEKNTPQGLGDENQKKDISLLESLPDLDLFLNDLTADEGDSISDLQGQVDRFKVELCRSLDEKRSAVLRAEELETALMEMVKQDNRRQLSARVEQLEQELGELKQALADKQEQESAMLQVLMRVEQEQKLTEDARRSAEQDSAAQRYAVEVLQEKYEKAMASLAQMETRAVMAESMLEATLQYESHQSKGSARQAPSQETKKTGLLSFGLGWRDRNKGKWSAAEESNESKLTTGGLEKNCSLVSNQEQEN